MIGIKRFCLETKKPVSETGVFWASTARTFSDLFDNHSVHHTGGMCKDSLLVFQQSFLELPATWFAWLSGASFRKESFAMTKGHGDEFNTSDNLQPIEISDWDDEYPHSGFFLNGYEFQIAVLPTTGLPAVVIPCPWVFDDPDFLSAIQNIQPYYHAFYKAQEAYMAATDPNGDYPLDDIGCVNVIIEGLVQKYIFVPERIQKLFKDSISTRMKQFSPSPGFVYLVQAIFPNDNYKIGYSTNPISRIESLGVKLPFPIEPMHLIPTNDVRKAEKKLHHQYADKRVNGEWFKLSKADIQEICKLDSLMVEV